MIISIERFLLSPNDLVDYIHPPILAACIKGCYIPIKK
jgi:hypothetical protein